MFQHLQNRLFRADAKLWPTMVAWQFTEAATAAASAVVAQKQQQVTELYNALKQNRDKLATPDQQILDEYESKIGAINKTSAKELADLHSTLEELAKVARIEVKSAPRPVTREATTKLIDDLVSLTDEEKAKLTTDDGKQIAAVQAAFAAWEDRGNNADQSGLATIHQQAQQLQTRLWKMLSKQQAATQEATKPAPKPAEVTLEQWTAFGDKLKAYIAEMKANNLDHATNKAAIEEFEKRLQNIVKIKPPANEAELRRLHADLVIFAEGAKQDMTTLPKLPEAGKPAAEKKEKPADPNKRYIKVRTTLNVRDKDGKVDSTLPPNAEITIDPTQTKRGLHPTDKSIEYVRVTLGVTGASAKELYVAKGDGKKSFLSDTPIMPEKPDGAKTKKPATKPGAKLKAAPKLGDKVDDALKATPGYKALNEWLASNLDGFGSPVIDKGPIEATDVNLTASLGTKNIRITLPQDGKGWIDVREVDTDGNPTNTVSFQAENLGDATSQLFIVPVWLGQFKKLDGKKEGLLAEEKLTELTKAALWAQWGMGPRLGIGMDQFTYDASDATKRVLKADYQGKVLELTVKDGKMDVTYDATSINTGYALGDAGFDQAVIELNAKVAPAAAPKPTPAPKKAAGGKKAAEIQAGLDQFATLITTLRNKPSKTTEETELLAAIDDKKLEVAPFQSGEYVNFIINPKTSRITKYYVKTDGSGLGKVPVYDNGNEWVVSINSLIEDHIQKQKDLKSNHLRTISWTSGETDLVFRSKDGQIYAVTVKKDGSTDGTWHDLDKRFTKNARLIEIDHTISHYNRNNPGIIRYTSNIEGARVEAGGGTLESDNLKVTLENKKEAKIWTNDNGRFGIGIVTDEKTWTTDPGHDLNDFLPSTNVHLAYMKALSSGESPARLIKLRNTLNQIPKAQIGGFDYAQNKGKAFMASATVNGKVFWVALDEANDYMVLDSQAKPLDFVAPGENNSKDPQTVINYLKNQ